MSRATTGEGKRRLTATPHVRRSLTDVIYVVAEHYGISPTELLGRTMSKAATEARSVAYAVCRDLTVCSAPEIGAVFNRDHTTVLVMIERVAKRAMKDVSFAYSFSVCRTRALEAVRARRMVP